MSLQHGLIDNNRMTLLNNGYGFQGFSFSIHLANKLLCSSNAYLVEHNGDTYTFEWEDGVRVNYSVKLDHTDPIAYLSMTVINRSQKNICIQSVSPLSIANETMVLGEGIDDWILYKNGIRKNDTVSIYKFQDPDYDLKEVIGQGDELGKITYIDSQQDQVSINSQYLTVLKSESTGQSILLGSIEPTQEFSSHNFICSRDEKNFESLSINVPLDNMTLSSDEEYNLGSVMISFEQDFKAIQHYAEISSQGLDKNWRQLPQLGWCSWYFFYENITQEKVLANAEIIKQYDLPLEVMLIDMGWEQRLGDWYANHKFSNGMKWMADQIKSYGLKPGLWLSPFWVEPRSEIHLNHPEWLLHDSSDKPIVFRCHIDGYIIDTSIPEAYQWITNVFKRVSKEWGFEVVKVDFLRAVAIYEQAQFKNPVSRAEALRLGMEAIRRGIGNDVTMIACGGQYGPTLDIADINRTSNDITAKWSSVRNTFKKNILRYWMNKKWWVNDPDCIILRDETEGTPGYIAGHKKDERGSFNNLEVETIIDLFKALNGTFLLGDDLSQLSDDKLIIIKEALKNYNKESSGAVPRDLFNNLYPHILEKKINSTTHEVTIVNWREESEGIQESWRLSELIGEQDDQSSYRVTNQKTGQVLGEFKVTDTLPACHIPLHGSIKLLITIA
ncbi:glycoside hydrolase family 36 protein [Vallitalea okinawensis]|uniref:glycoside hydrolase family 36 protein n=1 Tax=Vallitalea okinawensis TaxID=2078660 RepID=UPI000CFB2AA4|nr:glycoside hydrolase family 36 protein [Vallitalea okinawensis]